MDYDALTHMPVNKLRDEAKKFPDVKGVTGMKKDELIALIAEKHGLEIPTKKPKKTKHEYKLDKPTIHKKIAELREMQAAARAGDDHKQAAKLRRRIHLLKRETRKIAAQK